jgi:hypothetical protein
MVTLGFSDLTEGGFGIGACRNNFLLKKSGKLDEGIQEFPRFFLSEAPDPKSTKFATLKIKSIFHYYKIIDKKAFLVPISLTIINIKNCEN